MNRLSALVGVLVLAGCARTAVSGLPSEEPYVRGPVASFTHSATASNLLVRAGPGSREMCGISARVDARTRYLERARSGGTRTIERAAVAVGDTVEVYVAGPVAESCPVQGYAATVVRVGA